MTRLLLDTHVLLWAAAQPERLGSIAEVLADPDTVAVVSAASTWELAIKRGLGRLRLAVDVGTFVAEQRRRLDLVALAIRDDHAAAVEALPPLHRDPFDRMLVAQARIEELVLATADSHIALYDVPVIAP